MGDEVKTPDPASGAAPRNRTGGSTRAGAAVSSTRKVSTRRPRAHDGYAARIEFHALTADRWPDLERLFGERGACGGCWCMAWRLSRSDFNLGKGEGNRAAFRRLVQAGERPGILAYSQGVPVGWCAVAPREVYTVLGRSRTLKPIDDQPVWSVSCFFVAKGFRDRGLSVRLLEEAVGFVRERGGRIIEGYPVVPRKGRLPDPFVWRGLPSTFRRAGFTEVARRSDASPILRRVISK